MADGTSACTVHQQAWTREELERTIKAIKDLNSPNGLTIEWILIGPDGRMWKGEPMKLLQVLLQYHPLMPKPISLKDL